MGEFKSPSEKQNAKAAPAKKSQENSNVGEADLLDTRSSTFQLGKIQEVAQDGGRRSDISSLQTKSSNHSGTSRIAQLQRMSDERTASKQSALTQKNANKTGIPDGLKAGMESVSGISLNDVTVHRNSDKPAQLQAHAYAQGTDIHLGPGQEKHLPHEAWHVVQQKQGRVQATTQGNGNVPINDNPSLEREATQMGQKALKESNSGSSTLKNVTISPNNPAQLWNFPWSKKKEEEKPAEEHKQKSLSDVFGGAERSKKIQEMNERNDKVNAFALKQSASTDNFKPGQEGTLMNRIKAKKNAFSRGKNSFIENAKNRIGKTWLGGKLGISGLDKNETDAATERAPQVAKGLRAIRDESEKGQALEKQSAAIGTIGNGARKVAKNVPLVGGVLDKGIGAVSNGAQANRLERAGKAFHEAETSSSLAKYGTDALAKKLDHSARGKKLDMEKSAGGALGATADIFNPGAQVKSALSSVVGDEIADKIPSFATIGEKGMEFKNREKRKELEAEQPGTDANLALSAMRQDTGSWGNKKDLDNHLKARGGMLKELKGNFDSGESMGSKIGDGISGAFSSVGLTPRRLGFAEKGEAKLKDGVLKPLKAIDPRQKAIAPNQDPFKELKGNFDSGKRKDGVLKPLKAIDPRQKAIDPKQIEEKKTMNIGGMQIDPGHIEKMLAKARMNEPEDEVDNNNDW